MKPIALVGVIFLALSLACCAGNEKGAEFLGKWANIRHPSDTIEIIRNGDRFLILTGQGKIGAAFKDGALEYPGFSGPNTMEYVRASDTLVAPGIEYPQEYKRAK